MTKPTIELSRPPQNGPVVGAFPNADRRAPDSHLDYMTGDAILQPGDFHHNPHPVGAVALGAALEGKPRGTDGASAEYNVNILRALGQGTGPLPLVDIPTASYKSVGNPYDTGRYLGRVHIVQSHRAPRFRHRAPEHGRHRAT